MSSPKKFPHNLDIKARLATVAAILAVTVIVVQQLTDLGKAVQSFITIWSVDQPSIDPANIGIYESITDDRRIRNLRQIAIELHEQDPAILGIAYYRIETNRFAKTSLIYRQDSEIPNGEQTYFKDKVLKKEQIDTLRQLDCLVITDIGQLVDREKDDYFSAIVCPTIVQSRDSATGLVRNSLANASAIAFNPSIYKIKDIPIEPYSTFLFELSPSLESATKNN